jgi:perosamine synthetase
MTIQNLWARDKFLPVSKPEISKRDIRAVKVAMRSGWISSSGHSLETFDKILADSFRVPYVTSTSNGTTALHLALLALGIGPGDEVIIPNLAFVAVANAVLYVGAQPVLADIDMQHLGLTRDTVSTLITKRTKAVIAVHNYGLYSETKDLMLFLEPFGIFLIEDCAEAMFLETKNGVVGSFGHLSTYSFYGNKIITSGEGGAVASRDESLIERIRFLKNQGAVLGQKFYFPELAFNFRMTNIQAALLVSQAKRRYHFLEKRYKIFEEYISLLGDSPNIDQFYDENSRNYSPWLYSIRLNDKSLREPLIKYLQIRQIECRPFFYPLSLTPRFSDAPKSLNQVSESIAASSLSLPTFVGIKKKDIQRITKTILTFLAENS